MNIGEGDGVGGHPRRPTVRQRLKTDAGYSARWKSEQMIECGRILAEKMTGRDLQT